MKLAWKWIGAAVCILVGGVAIGLSVATGSEEPRFSAAISESGPPMAARAILGFGSGAAEAEVAVISADGRVEFLDSATGTLLGTIETGAAAWSRSFRKPNDHEPRHTYAQYGIPDPLVLAGIPVSVADGRTVAVVGEVLREWSSSNSSDPRDLLSAPWLREVRILAHAGVGGPVFLALGDGRLATVDGTDVRFSEWSFEGVPTALALAGPQGPVLIAGDGPCWDLVDGDTLTLIRRTALTLSPPPVTSLAMTHDGRRLAVATAFDTILETFEIVPDSFRPVRRQTWSPHFKGPSALSVAMHPTESAAILAKCLGGTETVMTGRYYGSPAGRAPSRATWFSEDGRKAFQGWDDGSHECWSWPEEDLLWKRPGK